MRRPLAALGLLAAVSIAALALWGGTSRSSPRASGSHDAAAQASPARGARAQTTARGRELFVGSTTCAPCHPSESQAHAASHHAQALVTPPRGPKEAHFDTGHFASKLGGLTTFARVAGEPAVTSLAHDGKIRTFPIAYVSGVWPLVQYVVATERGKLQALGVARDTREATRAEARWFHLYGRDGVGPGDPLFFSAPAQNWNHMCAECHSTWVERRYDEDSDSFDTRWAELSVGCEACHGPAAEHVRSAQAEPRAGIVPLPVQLKSSARWIPSETGSPKPQPRDGVQVEVCAPCHSRREPLKEGFLASDAFLDAFEPELLLPGRYHADGQVEGEVYEWGSFLQSRMYQAGVTCSDCHNPHSGKLKAQGNALCVRCHEPARFDAEAHSHHLRGPSRATPSCIDCHMPPSTFMQIDERRDHSIRVPRPDHSVSFGTPNACNGCHKDRTARWADEQVTSWSPTPRHRPHFVAALVKERQGAPDALHALRELAADTAQPTIARATALERLAQFPAQGTLATLRAALASGEPLVSYGAVLGSARLPMPQRASLLLPMLGHATRAVRVAAAKQLADVSAAALPTAARAALDRAFLEVEESFTVSASRPETHVERSAFKFARGEVREAESALATALRLAPCLAEAHLNLAELARQRNDEVAAERSIRSALACDADNAAAHHALGLWYVRARQRGAALLSLRKAVELAPSDVRFHYVLAVALHDNGQRDEAIRVLESALRVRPNDVTALEALAHYLREAGQTAPTFHPIPAR